MAEFPVSDEGIKALRVKVLRALAASTYPKEAIGPIAANNGQTVDDVRSLVKDYGYPDKSEMARFVIELSGGEVAHPEPPRTPLHVVDVNAGGPTSSTTSSSYRIETLLNAGDKSSKARTRRLAVKIREQVAELLGLVNSESAEREAAEKAGAEKAALLAEVKKLEQQLAAKKAALRGPAKPARSVAAPAKSTSTRNGAIRAWAAGQGIECTAYGRVPAAVVAAYDAEHTEQTG